MRDTNDVRDLSGRLFRVLISIPVGIACSLVVTYALPTRDHFERDIGCMRGEGWFVRGGSPTLIIIGAIVFAIGCYALLDQLVRRSYLTTELLQPKPRLAKAIARIRCAR
jgi:hypothetical protein